MARQRLSGRVIIPATLAAFLLIVLVVLRVAGADLPVIEIGVFVIALASLAFSLADMLVRDVRRTYTESIGVRALIVAVMMVEAILLFATAYLLVSARPDEIVGMSTPLDSIYFTMTTLMTIGFGDIAAQGQLARGLVLTQMLFSVLLLTASIRLLTSLVRSFTVEEGTRHRH